MERAMGAARRTARVAMVVPVCLAVALGAMQPAHAAPPSRPAAAGSWRPPACPPPAEQGEGPSSVKATGPCAFEHKGEAECEAAGDDLYVTVIRKAKKAAELMFFVNVERFVGPGKYKAPNDVLISLKDGPKIYRWWTNQTEVIVGPESRYVTLRNVRLEPELVLIGCTGPQSNFQCDGRSDDLAIMETTSTVSGTIYCKTGGATK